MGTGLRPVQAEQRSALFRVATSGTQLLFSLPRFEPRCKILCVESSLKLVRTVRLVLLASIVLYAVIAESARPAPGPRLWAYFYVATGLALWAAEGIFFFRRKKLRPSEKVLSTVPEDVRALRRWRTAYVVIYALSDSVALWGVVLRFMRFRLFQVLPFYVAGFPLLLYFTPRRPSDAIG